MKRTCWLQLVAVSPPARIEFPHETEFRKEAYGVSRTNQTHPYHLQPVQRPQAGDGDSRLQFCCWLLLKTVDELNFLIRVLGTNEAEFATSGTTNLHIFSFTGGCPPVYSCKYQVPALRCTSSLHTPGG
jgi:hypothetical protein